jgi:hypothetical protein
MRLLNDNENDTWILHHEISLLLILTCLIGHGKIKANQCHLTDDCRTNYDYVELVNV